MEKRLRIFFVALLTLLILAAVLPVAASLLYDGPVVLTISSGPAPEGIEAFLNNQLCFIHADFQYIGHSTHDLNTPEASIPMLWYASPLPGYVSLGTDASVLCLVSCDSSQTIVDPATAYIGTDRAIDSLTRRYAASFYPTDEP